MAIYHLSMKPIARSSGRSAVAAAAYRSGERLTNERDGLVHDFRAKSGIEHAEIVTPEGLDAEWAHDRSALWNAAEFSEKRKDARVAREFEVALPRELTAKERLDLTRVFGQGLADKYGAAVDFAIHSPDDATDVRNHHAHILMTTREVTPDGLGDKTILEKENRELVARGLPTSHDQLRDIRLSWEELANEHLARAGHDIRIDHRSHSDRGLELEPTQHMGVHATQMEQRGLSVDRKRLEDQAARQNAERIRANPNEVLTLITDEKSVFDKRDVARTLHRYISDDPTEYQALLTKVMASEQLVNLQDGKGEQHARYSTREMVDLEQGMMDDAIAMNGREDHAVSSRHVSNAIRRQDEAIGKSANTELIQQMERGEISQIELKKSWKAAGLSEEQVRAIEHVTNSQQISAVVGYAGAGKSTMLAAAREAWEAEGYTVHGAALAGKAAEGLEESSGIASRTLASWQYGWKKDSGRLTEKDVLVIDEAGMVGSKQLSAFVQVARHSGAKLVLVGDHEQLQAIGAGAAFRAIAEEVGFAQLSDIRRQKEGWQKEASVQFASHRTADALNAYNSHGDIRFSEDQDQARAALVRDYVEEMEARPDGTRAAMAHRRADVHQLNIEIRTALQESGKLPVSVRRAGNADTVEHVYDTNDGVRAFTTGDRILFLQNDGQMQVKNGGLGTVTRVDEGRIDVTMDGTKRHVAIYTDDYKAFDHGYATTIHKTQGSTVDRAFVLASDTMDRHLTYVAMTRHKEGVAMYAGKDEFEGMEGLSKRLSRSGAKETTLDYPKDTLERFAGRRGMDSDIVMPMVRQREQAKGVGQGEGTGIENLALHHDVRGGQGHHGSSNLAQGQGVGNDLNATSRTYDQAEDQVNRQRYEAALDTFLDVYARNAVSHHNATFEQVDRQRAQAAARTLETLKPGSLRLLRDVMVDDLQAGSRMSALTGQGRTDRFVEALARKEYETDPNVRASALAEKWNTLVERQKTEAATMHWSDRVSLEGEMRKVARAVRDDPEVDRILTQRQKEWGREIPAGKSFDQDLEQQIRKNKERDRGRDLEK